MCGFKSVTWGNHNRFVFAWPSHIAKPIQINPIIVLLRTCNYSQIQFHAFDAVVFCLFSKGIQNCKFELAKRGSHKNIEICVYVCKSSSLPNSCFFLFFLFFQESLKNALCKHPTCTCKVYIAYLVKWIPFDTSMNLPLSISVTYNV